MFVAKISKIVIDLILVSLAERRRKGVGGANAKRKAIQADVLDAAQLAEGPVSIAERSCPNESGRMGTLAHVSWDRETL